MNTETTQPRDLVRFTVDIDVYDLAEDTQRKLPRIIKESVQYALGDEAVGEVVEAAATPTEATA